MNVRAIALIWLLASMGTAWAEPPGVSPEEFNALKTYCKADVERLCAGVEPGGGRIKACLLDKKDQMSVGCAQALEKLGKAKP